MLIWRTKKSGSLTCRSSAGASPPNQKKLANKVKSMSTMRHAFSVFEAKWKSIEFFHTKLKAPVTSEDHFSQNIINITKPCNTYQFMITINDLLKQQVEIQHKENPSKVISLFIKAALWKFNIKKNPSIVISLNTEKSSLQTFFNLKI